MTTGPEDDNGVVIQDGSEWCHADEISAGNGASCTVNVFRYDDRIEGNFDSVVYCVYSGTLHTFNGYFEVKAP